MNKYIFRFICIFMLCMTPVFAQETINDSIMDELLNNANPKKPFQKTEYDYTSTEKIPVKLKITNKITTRNNSIYDNQLLTFTVRNPVKYKNKIILNTGDVFTANIATYMPRGMNGVPAIIIIDNFKSNKISQNKLAGTYIKKGLNLTPLVYPMKLALTIIPFAGTATNFIKGGNAKISENDTVTVYYYPEWQ